MVGSGIPVPSQIYLSSLIEPLAVEEYASVYSFPSEAFSKLC